MEELVRLHLLLARAGDHQPALAPGPELSTVFGELERPSPVRVPPSGRLYDPGGEPNDLSTQRWALVAPTGARGDRLLELVAPLTRRRAEQQGLELDQLPIFRVSPDMSRQEFLAWRHKLQSMPPKEQPRYLLLLGDADEISFEFQQQLAGDHFVGRLAFPDEAGFKAYVEKVLRSESDPPREERARVLFFTAHDGTTATDVGYQALVLPGMKLCAKSRQQGDFPASSVQELGVPGSWSARELSAMAAERTPGVLFTLSHGLGPSPAGWASAEEQRRRQGAMSLGEGQELTVDDVSGRPFLPDGLWVFFACFSAGTPSRSAYDPWLQRLNMGASLASVRASALVDQRPFVAALPQAALANPDGPLAVIGHVDLAWAYSFQDPSGHNHASRFVGVLRELVKHRRVGVGLSALTRFVASVNAELTLKYHEDEAAIAEGELPTQEPYHRAHLWMTRNDLSGYVLLGDPAARLPISGRPREFPK